MKYYLKRNIHFPVLTVQGSPIEWERIGNSGILATEDGDVVSYLDTAVKESKGAVKELTQEEYGNLTEAEKKTQSPPIRRTFAQQRVGVDASRSRGPSRKSEKQSSDTPVPDADPVAVTRKKSAAKRTSSATPIVEPPPGISGTADTPEP